MPLFEVREKITVTMVTNVVADTESDALALLNTDAGEPIDSFQSASSVDVYEIPEKIALSPCA